MGRPKKIVEEVSPDTAAVSFWDAEEGESPVIEVKVREEPRPSVVASPIADFDEAYNKSDKIPQSVIPEVVKEEPKVDVLDIRSAFKRKAEPVVFDAVNNRKPVVEEIKTPITNASEILKKLDKKVEEEEEVRSANEVAIDKTIDAVGKEFNFKDPMPENTAICLEKLDKLVAPVETKSNLQLKAELSQLNKSQMTPEQKQQFAELKYTEIVENTKVLEDSIIKFKQSIENAGVIDVKYYRDELNSIRNSRPKFPTEGNSPQTIIDIINNVGRNIERLSTLLGELTYVWNLYDGMIDTVEDMWSTVSLQSSEQTRRGECDIQISDVKIEHNEVKGLKAAYAVEMDALKQLKDCCAEQIKLIQIQIRLNETVIMNKEFEGVN